MGTWECRDCLKAHLGSLHLQDEAGVVTGAISQRGMACQLRSPSGGQGNVGPPCSLPGAPPQPQKATQSAHSLWHLCLNHCYRQQRFLGFRCSRGMLWLPGQKPCTPAQDLPPAPGRPQTATPPSYRAAHHRRGCGGSVLTEFSFTQDDTAHWDVTHQTLHKWAWWVHISTSLCVYLFDNDHVLICHTRRIGSIKDSPLGKQSPTINKGGGAEALNRLTLHLQQPHPS